MAVLVTEYQKIEPDKRGICHWVKFKYNADFVERVKRIPSSLRSFDPETKMWGFNEKGFNLFCAISGVKFLDEALQGDDDIPYRPRKINNNLEDIDWEKFRRPAVGRFPELYPYEFQKLGISQIIRNKGQGLFYEMGLGKTYTSICVSKELLDRGEVSQVLIISLVSGVIKQWALLLDRMGYSYTIIRDEKMVDRPQVYADTKTDFVLTLYTSVNSKGKVNRAKSRKFDKVFAEKAKKAPQMVIADELHKLGDVSSKTFRAFLAMAKKAKYRVACTGTIIKSTPDKALLPLRFIAPKVFNNKGVFEEAFMVKEAGMYRDEVIGYKNLERLKEIIHSYGCVALKRDHLKDLPEVLPVKQIIVETSKDSLAVLKSIRGDSTLKLVKNKSNVKYADLKDLYIRIHQALISPSIYSDKFMAKNMLEAVVSILENIEGKTIIFTTLVSAVEEISTYLTKNKISNVKCHGGIKPKILEENVSKFINDPDCEVMVSTVQKMGTGYDDLVVASNCIIYDFNLVAGDLRQAIGRLDRPGQKNKVSVIELIQDNVVSEYQREKVRIQEEILDQTEDSKAVTNDSIELTHLVQLALESNMFGGKI